MSKRKINDTEGISSAEPEASMEKAARSKKTLSYINDIRENAYESILAVSKFNVKEFLKKFLTPIETGGCGESEMDGCG